MTVQASIPTSVCPSGVPCPAGHENPTGKGCPELSLCRIRTLGVDTSGLVGGKATLAFERGAQISAAPKSPDGMCVRLVRSGLAGAAITLDDGRRQLVKLFVPGDMIWPLVPGDGEFCAEALADTEVLDLVLPKSKLEKRDADVSAICLRLCAEALEAAVTHQALLGRYTGLERLCAFLAEMAGRVGEPSARGYGLTLPMSRQDIADYLGLSPETVSRLFSRLRDLGALQLVSPTRIDIRDYGVVARNVPARPRLRRFDRAKGAMVQ